MWWRPGWGRSPEVPILTALVGGETARRFEAVRPEDVIEAALDDLSQMFNREQLRAELDTGLFVNWGGDPYSKMGYSYVPVGATGLRAVLAQPIAGVLFFAGEATNIKRAATVHGALESGQRAAREVMGS
jgi:monoamine oxidase